MTTSPHLTVIIPTHNRIAALRRTINSLAVQEYPADQFEVIVVADGCSDGTVAELRQLQTPFAMTCLEQNGEGAAAARNFGAAHARGRWLLFLDDDIEATPTLVAAHADAHQVKSQQVVMGYLPPQFEGNLDFFQIGLRCWWEQQFFAMSRPDHRFTYRDLLSGNFSIEAEFLRKAGGFNPTFRCREDYELGYRLLKQKAHFTFEPQAKGFHYDASTLDRACQRVFAEGKADVAMGRRHPELRASLLFNRVENMSARERMFFRIAFDHPRAGDLLARRWYRRLQTLERLHQRHEWRETLHQLRHYWYWRGVAAEIGGRTALANFLQSCPMRPSVDAVELDLQRGLKQAERDLDELKPESVWLRYGETVIGSIEPEPGAEPLRGIHLRSLLVEHFSKPLLAVLALEAAGPSLIETDETILSYAD